MRVAGRENMDRPDGSVPPAGNRRATPQISVVVGVISLVAAVVWMRTLTPQVEPTLTVEFPNSLASLLFGAALVVGTLLGVRNLWDITLFVSVLPSALVLSTATIRVRRRSAACSSRHRAGVPGAAVHHPAVRTSGDPPRPRLAGSSRRPVRDSSRSRRRGAGSATSTRRHRALDRIGRNGACADDDGLPVCRYASPGATPLHRTRSQATPTARRMTSTSRRQRHIGHNSGELRDGARPEVGPPCLSGDIEHDLTVDLDMPECDHAVSVRSLEGDRGALQDRNCLEGQRL